MSRRKDRSAEDKRRRVLITPEGVALPVMLASRGARAGALILDLLLIAVVLFAILAALGAAGLSGALEGIELENNPAIELLFVAILILIFLSRFGYFLFFELGPRGATPGKRMAGIRVAARPTAGEQSARLTAEAIIARNLMRDIEVFLPIGYLLSLGSVSGPAGLATTVWLAIFLFFPFFNRDNLRAGDLVGGTWVVEATRAKLPEAMSIAIDRSQTYRFGEAELSVYGEHELKVLEAVLRENRPEAMQSVMEAICRKIGWNAGRGDEREFLEAFYAALRAHLERGMRFGRRKLDKFDA